MELHNFLKGKNIISYEESKVVKKKINFAREGIDNSLKSITKNKCLGISKKGFQCSRLLRGNNKHCFQHKNSFLNESLNKVLPMDCIHGLKKIPKEFASIIICDPPYNINKDFGNNSDRQEFNKYLNWCKS